MKTKSELLKEMEADKIVLEKYFDIVRIKERSDSLVMRAQNLYCTASGFYNFLDTTRNYKPDPIAPEQGELVMDRRGRILYSTGLFTPAENLI